MTGQWINGTALEAAIAAERPVMIAYTAASGEHTTRTIEPYEIAPTATGHLLVRAMDRHSGEPRSFRLDRIETARVLDGVFMVDRPAHDGRHDGDDADLMPVILVDYHGSRARYHGSMRLLGICGCSRCADLGVRYRLAEVGRYEAAVWCVRPTSVTPLDEQDAAEEAALARIRAEIDMVPVYDHRGDAAHWSPDSPYAR